MTRMRFQRHFGILLGATLLAHSWAQPAAARIFADGFESGDFSAWSSVVGIAPEVYRFTDLDLRDPHVFVTVDIGIPLCLDFTDDPLPVVGFSLNGSLEEQVTLDGDGDGLLDLSTLLLFRPLDVAATSEQVDFGAGQCTDPPATTVCGPEPMAERLETAYSGQAAGTCLETVPGTTSGYVPAVDEPAGSCFVTVAETVSLQLGDITLDLEDLQIAAAFIGDPVTSLDTGLLRGFLSETVADALLLPPELPVVGGQPLSVLLPGGSGNCAPGDDRDLNDGVSGWWFYFNYTAEVVPYTGS
ncbi:MAG: hypothetical protein GY719_05200 [bacterium]|nr:hypothetical protein [bacterium]